jgi:hypothetical protein
MSANRKPLDLLSTVREIEDSETSLTYGQAVAFADPFYYTINAMGAAMRGLGLF